MSLNPRNLTWVTFATHPHGWVECWTLELESRVLFGQNAALFKVFENG